MKGFNELIMFMIKSSSYMSNSIETPFPSILIVRFLAFFNHATLQQYLQSQYWSSDNNQVYPAPESVLSFREIFKKHEGCGAIGDVLKKNDILLCKRIGFVFGIHVNGSCQFRKTHHGDAHHGCDIL